MDSGPEKNELNKNAWGGTELMQNRLYKEMPKDLIDQFQIICSRPRKLKKDKKKILWLHVLAQDPEVEHLKDGGHEKYDKLVFVSHWQFQDYMYHLGIPHSSGYVLQNAIDPIEEHEKPDDEINLVYFSTPHRGLEFLVPVMDWVEEMLPDINWHLDVYSSFEIYGWKERDKEYEGLFEKIKNHPDMTYHGHVPNEEVKEALKKAHIYALPSLWPETSCISLIEAMSAGCICVHPSLAALPETSANWTFQYDFTEDMQDHASRHALTLMDAMRIVGDENMQARLDMQKAYVDGFYSWDVRQQQWTVFLNNLLQP